MNSTSLEHSPIFVFGFHRSGSTLLQSILNAHPSVMIWGENGGFLENLLNASASFKFWGDHSTMLRSKSKASTEFHTSANHFTSEDLEAKLAIALTELYSCGTQVRWGFKEVRHHSTEIINFIHRLWPKAKIIFLGRDIESQVVSTLSVKWSITEIERYLRLDNAHLGGQYAQNELRHLVHSIIKVVQSRRYNADTAGLYKVEYSSLTEAEVLEGHDPKSHVYRTVTDLLEYLDLSISNYDWQQLKVILGTRLTSKETEVKGILSKENLTAIARDELIAILNGKVMSTHPLVPRVCGAFGDDAYSY